MEQIQQLLEDIITLAEAQDGFYEVEASVLIRKNGGTSSSFTRLQLDASDLTNYKVTTKTRETNEGAPPPDWF